MRIVSCGEAVVDFLPGGEGWAARLGGSPFNVAVGLARLGIETGFLGRLSTDLFGDQFARRLAQEGISPALVTRSTDPSLLAFVDLQQATPRYAFYSSGAADLGMVNTPPMPDTVRVLHVGSLAWSRGTTAATLEVLVARESNRRLVSFDPNLRATLISNLAELRARFDRTIARAHIVKLSDEDIAILAPGRDVQEVAAEIAARGPALVIVTQGARPVLWRMLGDAGTSPAIATDVADTIGAGDAFTAGLLAALAQRNLDSPTLLRAVPAALLQDCITYATRCASITCSRVGADPPHARDVA